MVKESIREFEILRNPLNLLYTGDSFEILRWDIILQFIFLLLVSLKFYGECLIS